MLSAVRSVWIVLIGNGDVASFRKNHSVAVSSLVDALDVGDLAHLVLCVYSVELLCLLKNGLPHGDKFPGFVSLLFLLCLTSM